MDRQPGDPDRRGGAARRPGARRHPRSAGPAGSLFARADLRPRQRLSEELERRHRRAGQGRPGDRRDRGAGSRPAIAAGARRSRQPAGQRQAVGGDAEPPPDRWSPRTSSRSRKSTSAPPTSPTRRPRSIPARPMSSGWRRWRLQEDHRAVRRRRHRARHRRRRADQCRRRRRAGDVRGLRHRASCASMSTCRRTTCPRSRSAPRR